MPRPVKCRKVCHFPNVLEFLPADGTEKSTPIVLTVDEYETIRKRDEGADIFLDKLNSQSKTPQQVEDEALAV